MTKPVRQLRWFIAYWISRTGAFLGRFIPARFWYALAVPISDLCFLVMRPQRSVMIENLRRVVGDEAAETTARRAFRNFARYVIDFYQLPYLGRERLCGRMEFHDWRSLDDALSDPEGSIFVTLHLGQAELGAGAMAAYGHPVNAITETLDYPPMDEFVQGLRRGLGMKVIPASKARLGVLRCLNRGEALAMMLDTVEPEGGVIVDFFGAPAEFSSAPARIALRTGSRVLAGVVARKEDEPTRLMPLIDFAVRYELTGEEETDITAITQALAHSLEAYVRRFPEQWFAFHPVWANPAEPSKQSSKWKARLLTAGMKAGALLPAKASYALARLGADAAFELRKGARADVIDNVRHVLGPEAHSDFVERTAREIFRNVGRYYVDLIRIPRMDLLSRIGGDIRLHDFDRLKSRLDAGQGAVVATAHYGNPELAVQVGTMLGLNTFALAEPLQPPAFADAMKQLRSAFGTHFEDVSFSAVSAAIRHLRDGGCLAIACDRDIQNKGTPLPFFGVETRMPLGAAELAARTRTTLMPARCKRSADGFDIYFEEPIELVNTGRPKEDAITNTLALLARVEEWIREDPAQWMVLDRMWKPLQTKRPLRILSKAATR